MAVASPHVNKLYGVSSRINPHYRSVRLGWQFDASTKEFILYGYTHMNGEREIHKVEKVRVPIGTEITLHLEADSYSMSMRLEIAGEDRMFIEMYRNDNKSKALLPAFMTHPYWGGIEQSPQYMSTLVTGIERSKAIRTFNAMFQLAPSLTSIVSFIILFVLTALIGTISVPLMFVFLSVPVLFHLIFVNQWVYVKMSSLIRRLKTNG